MVCEAGASQAQHSGTCCFPSIKTPLNVEGSFSERTLLPHFLQCSVPSNFLNSPPTSALTAAQAWTTGPVLPLGRTRPLPCIPGGIGIVESPRLQNVDIYVRVCSSGERILGSLLLKALANTTTGFYKYGLTGVCCCPVDPEEYLRK